MDVEHVLEGATREKELLLQSELLPAVSFIVWIENLRDRLGGHLVVDGAIVVAMIENLEVEGNKAIRLPLGGAGIRSIEFDDTRKAFHLITGAGPNSEKMDFKLWAWSGNSESPTLREIDTFDRRLKPEGITRVSTGAEDFIFIVFDTSGYTATD